MANGCGQRSWLQLIDGPNTLTDGTALTASGVHTDVLQLVEATRAGASPDAVCCLMSNSCGGVASNTASLNICAPDFDCSGSLAIADIFAFLNAWFAGGCN